MRLNNEKVLFSTTSKIVERVRQKKRIIQPREKDDI